MLKAGDKLPLQTSIIDLRDSRFSRALLQLTSTTGLVSVKEIGRQLGINDEARIAQLEAFRNQAISIVVRLDEVRNRVAALEKSIKEATLKGDALW